MQCILMPCKFDKQLIGHFFTHLDYLITLHQRKLELLQKSRNPCLTRCLCEGR